MHLVMATMLQRLWRNLLPDTLKQTNKNIHKQTLKYLKLQRIRAKARKKHMNIELYKN